MGIKHKPCSQSHATVRLICSHVEGRALAVPKYIVLNEVPSATSLGSRSTIVMHRTVLVVRTNFVKSFVHTEIQDGGVWAPVYAESIASIVTKKSRRD